MCSDQANSYFPYAEPRPGQLSLIHAIKEEVSVGNHLCVEAANGFGKTIAALSGVLPLLADRTFGIIYVTRTHKQLDRVMQELRQISNSTGHKGIVHRGRAASCLNPLVRKYAANAQVAMYMCSQLKRLGRCSFYKNLVNKTKKNGNFHRDFIYTPLTGLEFRSKCQAEKVCPYELSKRLLPLVNVVATTYFQVFDPNIRQMFFDAFGHPISQTILLLDEAHNLPRIGVELASAKLSINSINRSLKETKKYNLPKIGRFCVIIENLIQHLLETRKEDEILLEQSEFTQQICKFLKISDFSVFAKSMQQTADKIISQLLAHDEPPVSYIHSLARFFVNWSYFLDRTDAAFFLTRNGLNSSSVNLEIIALDPRTSTASILNSCHASVHLSGTLKPAKAHIDLVGLPNNTRILNLPSPFSQDQMLTLISLGVTTAMKYRTPKMYEKISHRILEACRATPHNVGIFVPSYSVLNALLVAGLEELLDRELFIEKPGMSSNENDSLIKKFKQKSDEGAGLLGVLSGRNSEGEDYPGHEMETVVIVGVPYARPSPRESARIDYFERHFPRKGRLYGYQLPAMRSASQAAGRSIRRLDDKGAIVFLDDRYATRYCNRLLPSWINENLRGSKDADEVLYNHLKLFYSTNKYSQTC